MWFLGCAESETWNSWLRSPRLPPPGSLSVVGDGVLLATREARFPASSLCNENAAASGDATLIELSFAAQALSEVILRFPSGPFALWRVETAEQLFSGPSWLDAALCGCAFPLPQPALLRTGDGLADALRKLAAERGPQEDEPTLEDVFRLALPYRGGALLGIPEGPIAYQLWNGSLVVRPAGALWAAELGDRVLLQLEFAARPLLAQAQRLKKGYLPVGEVELETAELRIQESAYVDETGALRLFLQFYNRGAQAVKIGLRAVAARRLPAKNDATLQAEVHTPLSCSLAADTLCIARLEAAASQTERVDFTVAAGGSSAAALRLPLGRKAAGGPFDTDAESFLAAGATLALPDPHLENLWRALLLQTRLFVRDGVMRYGLFPGLYENGLFGIEEGWNIVSLAQYGHKEAAQATLERTFFDAEFLKKEGPHHQYRNGLAITYALDVYALGGEREFLYRLWPTIKESAQWIAAAFFSTRTDAGGSRPLHYGLLPKHIYGGDLRTPAYSLYASSACWRGLRDAARVAALLGEEAFAARFAQAAATVRADILTAASRIYRADAKPPFLPFRTDETQDAPSSGDYYQLFASLILETAVFGWRGGFARILTDYLEATGRMVLGVPRFDPWFGRLGVDAEYARGSQLAALHRQEFDRFYLGFLGQLGLSCDPHTFVSPETVFVRFSEEEQQDRLRVLGSQAARADSDPCSAGTGVMLQYLRWLLVCEARDEDDLPTGILWLGAGAPRAWFRPGTSFAVSRLPTLFGPISFRCTVEERWVVYDLRTEGPVELELFFRTADGKRCKTRARVEGETRLTLSRTFPSYT